MASYRESLNERETAAAGEVLFQNINDVLALYKDYSMASIDGTLVLHKTLTPKNAIIECQIIPEIDEWYSIAGYDPVPISTIGRYVDIRRVFAPEDSYGNKFLLNTDITTGIIVEIGKRDISSRLRIRHDFGQQVVFLTRSGNTMPVNQFTVKAVNNIIESILGKEMSKSFRRIGKHYKNRLG